MVGMEDHAIFNGCHEITEKLFAREIDTEELQREVRELNFRYRKRRGEQGRSG